MRPLQPCSILLSYLIQHRNHIISLCALLFSIFFCFTSALMIGQTFTMTNGQTVNACNGTFYDPGGTGISPIGDYTNSLNSTYSICSGIAGQCVQVTFTSFNTESGFDILRVYDGPTNAGTLLGTYSGTTVPPPLTATTGCLTFNFTTDVSVVRPGWEATITCVNCPAPVIPANDLICNAIPITCGQTLNGTTINATNAGTGEVQNCGVNQTMPGVWYSVAGTGSSMVASLCGTAWDSKIEVFSGANCSAVTCVGGNNNNGPWCTGNTASFSWNSIPGTNYYILVSGASTDAPFSLSLFCTPSNDFVCSATPITCGQTIAGTTINASLSGTGEVANGCGGTATQPGVWYSVPGNGQIMTASLCGTAWDSRVQVFSGADCSALTCIGGNDDGGPACAGTSASFQWTSVVGLNYYIFVSGFGSNSAFNLALTCAAPPTPPGNDLICNATPITCGQTLNGTTINATLTGTGEGQACGGFTQTQPGVWYSIVGTGTNINMSLCANAWDSRIQVFSGVNCAAVNCVGGNDNNGPLCAGNAASYSWLAANGQTYYVLISGANGSAFSLAAACQTPCTASCNGGTPPANDACSGAQNLGAIPTPPLCTVGTGVGTPVNFNLSNICATAEPNYTSLLGCTPSGNQASPAADVWYRFTIVAPILNVTINGLGTPNVALYEGTNCTNMIPRGCSIGSGGYLNTQFQGLAPGTYYLQVSGGDVLDQCNFALTLQNNYDCAGCVLAANLDVTPPPVNGQYQPNTLVTFCYTVTSYQQTSANWLHGVIPTFGPGWDLASFVPLAITTVGGATSSSCSTGGTWSWYNSNITGTATGTVTGPGFYYETAAGGPPIDGNPGNNFGDANPGACQWTFCWQIRTKPLTNCIQDQSLNMTINTTGDGESGSWSSLACTQDPVVNFFAQMNCCPIPTITTTNVLCFGQSTGSATATALGTGPWNYVWRNAAGNVIQTNANVAGSSVINNLPAGDYVLQVTDATNCVSSVAFSITQPAQLTATVSAVQSTICSGTAASFTFTGTPNATVLYALNGGASQSIVLNASGSATLTTAALTVNTSLTLISVSTASPACIQNLNGTAVVTVLPLPTVTIGNGISVCFGTSGNISFTGTPNAIVSYTVNGGVAQSLTLSGAGNAIISTGVLTANATYSLVSVSLPGATPCSQPVSGTSIATVVPLPTASVTANLAPCLGNNSQITFTGTASANVVFTINGGANQNIALSTGGTAIYNAGAIAAPITVTLVSVSTVGALVCTQPLTSSITITPRPAPTAAASVVTPVCLGNTSTVSFSGTPNTTVTFSFNGGANQTIALGASGSAIWITPVINSTATVSLVSVAYTSGSACSQPLSALYTINVESGVAPTFNAIGPFCYGTAAPALPTTSTNGVTGTWSPSSINTQLVGVTNYTFTPSAGNGCAGSPVVVPVTVYELPLVYAHGTNPTCTTICNGTATVDATGGLPPYTYSWSNGAATQSISNLCVGNYTITVTDARGCQSQAFTPVTGCFQIQSILVDVCGGGTTEGLNEMVFFQNGTSPLNMAGVSVAWPANAFNNFNCTNQPFIDAVNATITGGGVMLPLPASGIIPPNANVVMITSNTTTAAPNSFAGLSDTLYVMFHCANISAGYFVNSTGTGTRTLTINFGAGCSDVVTYTVASLVNINGTTGGSATSQDGSTVNFSQAGNPTYVNYGCVAPFAVQDNSVFLTAPTPITPTFATVGPYCSGAVIAALPTTSLNGITGTWSPAINNTATTAYTFTPAAGICATTTTLTITVNPQIAPSFNAVGPYCSGDAIAALPTTSLNGIAGAWTPAVNNAATTTYTFTPTAGQCATTAVLTITINPNITPTFAAVGPYCSGDAIAALPTASLNGISGTWIPAINNASTTTYTFTPTAGQCAMSTQLSVVVLDVIDWSNLQFPGNAQICEGSSFTAYGQLYNTGAVNTPDPGAAVGVTVQIGYSLTNTNPNTWTTWQSASFNAQIGNNDEYQGVLSGLAPGTYYYTFRYQINGCSWQYGGYSAMGGGFWNGTTNLSGVLTVVPAPQAGADAAVSLCNSGSPLNLFSTLGASAQTTGSWSGPAALGGGYLGAFNPSANPSGPYIYTVPGGVCPSDVATVTITITSSPNASIAYPSPLCNDVTTSISPTISGSFGGSFSATPAGLTLTANGSFVPSNSAIGTYTITYTVPAANGCAAINAQTQVVIVVAPALPSLLGAPLCADTAVVFTAGNGALYEFFINGVSVGNPSSTNVFDTTGLSAGAVVCVRSYLSTPIMDGSLLDSEWPPYLPGTTGGPASLAPFIDSRLDGFKVLIRRGMLYGAIAGSEIDGATQAENNRVILFIDSKPGGFNSLAAWTNRSGLPANTNGIINLNGGIVFDAGFEPDYLLAMNRANLAGVTYYDLYDMTSNTNTFLGSSPSALLGFQENGFDGDLSKGFEFAFPLTAIGSPSVSIRFFGMMVNDPSSAQASFISNQFMTTGALGEGNYGDGPVYFSSAAPNPVTVPIPPECFKETCLAINPTITPVFSPISPICSGTTIGDLPNTSVNGVVGSWSPAINTSVTTTYTFTPSGAGCASTTTLTIDVNPLPTTSGVMHE
jgi:hypothetical protein